MGNKITLVMPTRNEIEGMKALMPRVKSEWLDQIIVVDAGSTDGTIEFAKMNGYEVHLPKRAGLRKEMIENFKNIRGNIIITFSPDGNSVPEILPDLIKKINEGYDMVIVSRYLGSAKSEDDTPMTKMGNRFFTTIIGLLFGYKYTDALVMYRAYKKEVVEKLGILEPRSNFYEKYIGRFISWEPQLSIRAAKSKLKIAEIPGDEPRRVGDDQRTGLLPDSRINHYKSGLACLYLVIDELFRKRRIKDSELPLSKNPQDTQEDK